MRHAWSRKTKLVALFVILLAPTVAVFMYYATDFNYSQFWESEPTSALSGIQTITAHAPNDVLSSDESTNATFTARVSALQAREASYEMNPGLADCTRAVFAFTDDAPKAKQVFHDGDVLRISINYSGPGCRRVSGNVFGYFEPHSPWYEYHHKGSGRFWGVIPTETLALDGHSGVAHLSVTPGPFPPPDLASPPNLEGFVFCGAVLTFDDGTSRDYNPGEQLDAGCGDSSFTFRQGPGIVFNPVGTEIPSVATPDAR